MALFSSVEESRKRRGRFADTLMLQGMDASPIQHPVQGVARIIQALTGGYLSGELDREDKERTSKLLKAMRPPGFDSPATPSVAPGDTLPGSQPPPNVAARPEQPMWTAPGIPGVLPGSSAPVQDAGTWHTRQNNPGNIRMTDASLKAYPGAMPGQNGFLAFNTPEQGLAAIGQTIRHIAKTTGQNTLAGIISVYAPKGDGANDPMAYAMALSRETGIPVDAPLNLDDPATMQKLVPAMIRVETGKASPYTPQQLASVTGRPPGAPPAPVAPQVAQAPATTATDAIPKEQRDYIQRLVDSGEPELVQMGMQLWQKYQELPKPTDEMREYELYKKQGGTKSFFDYKMDLKRAGATAVTVDTKGETKFAEGMGKHFSEQYAKVMEGAQLARQKIATLDALGQNLAQAGRTGFAAETMLGLKRAAKAAGIDTGDLGPAETARAITNQLALQLRNPSSGAGMPGAMSDKDREFLVASVPGLSRTPEGNAKLIEYMTRMERRSIQVADMMNRYVAAKGKLDPGFYAELSQWSEANPLFPEAKATPVSTAGPDSGWKDVPGGRIKRVR